MFSFHRTKFYDTKSCLTTLSTVLYIKYRTLSTYFTLSTELYIKYILYIKYRTLY